MKVLINFKTTIPAVLASAFLTCFGLLPRTLAVTPAPDGGYPGFNTAEGQNALFSLTTGVGNSAIGWYSLWSNTDGSFNTGVGAGTLLFNVGNQSTLEGVENTAIGAAALLFNTTGRNNTAVGTQALFSNTTGVVNTAIGYQALASNTSGSFNTANGLYALASNTSGGTNTALGYGAGSSQTTGDNNIYIRDPGVAAESGTIRIGINEVQVRAFMAGIHGVTTGIADAVPVLVDSDGQLGTASSSRRFKHEIKPMDQASESILALKPVTFRYKSHSSSTPQFGLIAEEVAEVNPDLVVRDENGEIYTVRYDAVNAMLLNEFLKEHRKVEQLEATLEAVNARLQQQAAQIQKVAAQVEATKPLPLVVLNNP